MLYLVTGASGSGKTACLDVLRQRNPQVIWYDFDDVGLPANADKRWRHRTTEYWLQRAGQNQAKGLDTRIDGNIILGEVLAALRLQKSIALVSLTNAESEQGIKKGGYLTSPSYAGERYFVAESAAQSCTRSR